MMGGGGEGGRVVTQAGKEGALIGMHGAWMEGGWINCLWGRRREGGVR